MSINAVAPLAGAWIEITKAALGRMQGNRVAPLAGAWIEIAEDNERFIRQYVAPLAGAWIEIANGSSRSQKSDSRSPRGSVD